MPYGRTDRQGFSLYLLLPRLIQATHVSLCCSCPMGRWTEGSISVAVSPFLSTGAKLISVSFTALWLVLEHCFSGCCQSLTIHKHSFQTLAILREREKNPLLKVKKQSPCRNASADGKENSLLSQLMKENGLCDLAVVSLYLTSNWMCSIFRCRRIYWTPAGEARQRKQTDCV